MLALRLCAFGKSLTFHLDHLVHTYTYVCVCINTLYGIYEYILHTNTHTYMI